MKSSRQVMIERICEATTLEKLLLTFDHHRLAELFKKFDGSKQIDEVDLVLEDPERNPHGLTRENLAGDEHWKHWYGWKGGSSDESEIYFLPEVLREYNWLHRGIPPKRTAVGAQ